MGTEYTVAKDGFGTLTISEMSNRLTLEAFIDEGFGEDEEYICILADKKPEELLKVAEEIIKVVSYWVDDPDKVLKRYGVHY